MMIALNYFSFRSRPHAITSVALMGFAIFAAFPFSLLRAEKKETTQKTVSENPTAYTALRVIQKDLGPNALKQVVEISGREGVPQPYIWRVTLNDAPAASVSKKTAQDSQSDNLKEVDIAGGKIVGQRVVSRSSRSLVGVLVNLQNLNLDSSGAFHLADNQARKAGVSFSSVNYVLRADPSGKPIWTLQIHDNDGDDLGSMSIAATDATVINATGKMAAVAAATGDHSNAHTANAAQPLRKKSSASSKKRSASSGVSGFFERSGRTLDKTGDSIKSGFQKTGKTLSNFFSHKDRSESSANAD